MSDIHICEVGPRDGLQNESRRLTVADKLKFISLLKEAGLPEIEVGAFVSPKWVPQMADSAQVMEALRGQKQPIYTVLVPNVKGLERALEAGAKKIAVFAAASETFSQKNINCSVQESIERFKDVISEAQKNKLSVRGYVSTVLVCPYEGDIKPQAVLSVVDQLADLGIQDISLGDTIGKGTKEQVKVLLDLLLKNHSKEILAMHFHDTYKKAIENVETSLDFGISRYDSSAGGIGGCPYAPGAQGNVSTQALVDLFQKRGLSTGVDSQKLKIADQFIQGLLS